MSDITKTDLINELCDWKNYDSEVHGTKTEFALAQIEAITPQYNKRKEALENALVELGATPKEFLKKRLVRRLANKAEEDYITTNDSVTL